MIWLVAAIGLWIGAGYPLSAIVLTVLTVLTLTLLGTWENRLLGKCRTRECRILVHGDPAAVRVRIEKTLRDQRIPIQTLGLELVEEGVRLSFPVCTNHPVHRGFLTDLLEFEGVREIKTGTS
jgi:uncharacterized membrane protein YhiD involved in acid resistance